MVGGEGKKHRVLFHFKATGTFVQMLVTQSCPTLCDPIDYRPPGSSVHGIRQARILEWVAISFSGGLPKPGIKHCFLTLQADSLPTEPPGKPFVQLCYKFMVSHIPSLPTPSYNSLEQLKELRKVPCLQLPFYYKEHNSGTAKWKRYLRQGHWWGMV